jgi:hypothetical protein
MTIIVEDGSGISDANSYVSLEDARIYVSSIGLALPAPDEDAEAALLTAMIYIENQPYQGYRANTTQALQWPRKNVVSHGYPVASNVVPVAIWQAQARAAVMVGEGVTLTAEEYSSAVIVKEKVGPIETEYSDKNMVLGTSQFPILDTYLSAYLNIIGGYKLSPLFGF